MVRRVLIHGVQGLQREFEKFRVSGFFFQYPFQKFDHERTGGEGVPVFFERFKSCFGAGLSEIGVVTTFPAFDRKVAQEFHMVGAAAFDVAEAFGKAVDFAFFFGQKRHKGVLFVEGAYFEDDAVELAFPTSHWNV